MTIDAYETATFWCWALTDDSTIINYIWYFADKSQPLIIDNQTVQTYLLQFGDTQLSVDTRLDSDGGAERAGIYRCVADNGYSSDVAEFQLNVNTSQFTLCCSTHFSSRQPSYNLTATIANVVHHL